MLVLARKAQEDLVIAGNIRVRVLEIQGSRVRLGIEAPAEVDVRRSEMPAKEFVAEVKVAPREAAPAPEIPNGSASRRRRAISAK
jgi:carbon storage regulator